MKIKHQGYCGRKGAGVLPLPACMQQLATVGGDAICPKYENAHAAPTQVAADNSGQPTHVYNPPKPHTWQNAPTLDISPRLRLVICSTVWEGGDLGNSMLPIIKLNADTSITPARKMGSRGGERGCSSSAAQVPDAKRHFPSMFHTAVLCVPLGGSYSQKATIRPSICKPPPLAGLCIVCVVAVASFWKPELHTSQAFQKAWRKKRWLPF